MKIKKDDKVVVLSGKDKRWRVVEIIEKAK